MSSHRQSCTPNVCFFTAFLLSLGAVGLSIPYAKAQGFTGSGLALNDSRKVVAADLHVDANNNGLQDGSALRPFKSVQQAINAARANAVIAVAGGIYFENIRVQEKSVRLYGGFPGGTKANYASGKAGNFTTRDPAASPSHLKGNGKDSVVSLQEAGASIVDGFLVTGGGRSLLGAPSWLGGGFYVYGGSPTISNNVIEKNHTCPPVPQKDEKFGGGIYAASAKISILNNIIRNNVAGRGAGISADCPKIVIRGNIIQNNLGVSDHGGGIFLFSPDAEISHNRIEGNEIGRALNYGWGGGIIVVNVGGKYRLSHNIFTSNFAPSVGSALFVDEGAHASLDHDLFFANACNPKGDGPVAPIYADGADDKIGSSLDINHITVANHTCKADGTGYAIRVTGKSKVTVKNSVLWNNGGGDIIVDNISKAAVSYTLTQKAVKGVGNISKDPLFVNPAGQDYRLGKKSPAIDAADPDAPFNLEPAPNGGRADLGAFGNTAWAGVNEKGDVVNKEVGPSGKTRNAFLLRGASGELPSEVGDDNTKMTKIASNEFGGAAIKIELIDSLGQTKAKIEDWTSYQTLCLEIVNAGVKELKVDFNLFHSGTKAFATRVVSPFVLKPGRNDIRIVIKNLRNTNGSPANLAEVRRWYISSEMRTTLIVGDIYLEGKAN